VAGGGYLPVLCDKLLMTEGSGLYLAGPALVKSAIGQEASHDELGGARMHAAVSGTIDFREPDDPACLARVRRLVELLPGDSRNPRFRRVATEAAEFPAERLYDIVPPQPQARYEARDVLRAIVDAGTLCEYKPEFGKSLVCGYARLGGFPVGVLVNRRAALWGRDLPRERGQGGPLRDGLQPDLAAADLSA